MPTGVTWLPKLWNIIKTVLPGVGHKFDFSHAKNVTVFINPQSSGPMTVSPSGEIVTLNFANFPRHGQELAPFLREVLEQPDGFILEESALSTIEGVQICENNLEVKQEIEYFREILPATDLTILRSCFYLRKIHNGNMHPREVSKLKSQIVRIYGKRGANMANLCTAGYFESWIRPLYEEIAKNEGSKAVALVKFQKVYNNIVEELPRTVFVSQTMSASDLEKQILYKLEKIKSYGTDGLNIHALSGPNVNKVRSVIPLIEQRYPDILKSVFEEGARIIIQLQIKPVTKAP